MRKLWPLYYGNFSTYVWAAIVSVSAHLVFALFMYLQSATDLLFCLCMPGWTVFMLVTRRGIEEAEFSWPGIGIAVNLAFYLFVPFGFIRYLRPQPKEGWWPVKRYSKDIQ